MRPVEFKTKYGAFDGQRIDEFIADFRVIVDRQVEIYKNGRSWSRYVVDTIKRAAFDRFSEVARQLPNTPLEAWDRIVDSIFKPLYSEFEEDPIVRAARERREAEAARTRAYNNARKEAFRKAGNDSTRFSRDFMEDILRQAFGAHGVKFKVSAFSTGGRSAAPYEFSTLEIEPTTDEKLIMKAFRKRSFACHPDHGGTNELFIALTKAKDVCIAYAQRNRH